LASGVRLPNAHNPRLVSGPSLRSPITPVALCAALAAALLIVDPNVRDLSAHVFRAELFEREGFAIWNGSWFGGHYALTYSVLYPPLAAVLSPELVGALAAVASAYSFDALVRGRWGDRAIWASLWFAVLAAAILANGNIAFLLGVAFGLGSLLALQRDRSWLAVLAAIACSLSSPVAAAFAAGLALVVAVVASDRRTVALAVAAAAVLPFAALNMVFPEPGEQPFSVNSWIAAPIWCLGALVATRRLTGERGLRLALVGYVVCVTLVWLVPNPLGDNSLRLAAFFGGPVLLAALLAHRPLPRDGLTVLAALATLAWSLYWPLSDPVDELADASGDPSGEEAFYEPLERWLRGHGGELVRIEVPVTENYWESAYLAPEFTLARGWLRQLDADRNELFFRDRLGHSRYRDWLRRNGVRYVAVPDAEPHYFSDEERKLILSDPPYLEPRWSSEDWRVWEVSDPRPMVESRGGGQAELRALGPQSFTLAVRRPGSFRVLVRDSPYWEVVGEQGCVAEAPPWLEVRAEEAGPLRVEARFSLDAASRAVRGEERAC
jgi:hypothetical protein